MSKVNVFYQRVKEEDNKKIMYGCEEIASGEYAKDEPFQVFQSDNKNVITIVSGGYYNHILLEDIIHAVLSDDLKIRREIWKQSYDDADTERYQLRKEVISLKSKLSLAEEGLNRIYECGIGGFDTPCRSCGMKLEIAQETLRGCAYMTPAEEIQSLKDEIKKLQTINGNILIDKLADANDVKTAFGMILDFINLRESQLSKANGLIEEMAFIINEFLEDMGDRNCPETKFTKQVDSLLIKYRDYKGLKNENKAIPNKEER